MAKAKGPALFADGELADAPDEICTGALEAYNAVAKACNWRVALILTEARKKALRRAVKDYGGLIGFRAAMQRASKSPFLLGHVGRSEAHRTWKPDLDFFTQPKSIVALLEGKYDGEIEQPNKRIIMPTVWKPPHLRDAKPFVPEAREVRLAAMIVSYRKVENYQRANQLEEELAALEGRPPVLVPAPDVARFGMPDGPTEIPARDSPKATGKSSPKTAPNYARDYSAGPQVTDVVDEYDAVPEGEQYDDD